MHRDYHRWHSPSLGRDMELLVFGHGGARVLVFPTRDGRFHEYEDLRIVEALAPRIRAGELQLWCVDSLDWESFYCFWCRPEDRIRRHILFERYILEEVLPFMGRQNPDPRLIAHGCSLGAFHAANIAFRHPHLFSKLVAFSGRFDLTRPVESFQDLFGGYYDENIYFHTPTHFLPNLSCETRLGHLRRMEIDLAVGAEDPFLGSNRQLSEILFAKGVHNRLHVWAGRAHRGYYWRRMAPNYL